MANNIPNEPSIEQQLQTIHDTLNGIVGSLDGIDGRLDGIDGRSNVSIARFTNWQMITFVGDPNWRTVNLVSIVKYTFGHPFLPQPNVGGVQFAPDYPLGSQPPAGLMPTNNDEIGRWLARLTVEQLREKFSGIYWFYNDVRFKLPDNAPLEVIRNANNTLADFFCHE